MKGYAQWVTVEVDSRDRVVGRHRHPPSRAKIIGAHNRGHRVLVCDVPAVVLLGTPLSALTGRWFPVVVPSV